MDGDEPARPHDDPALRPAATAGAGADGTVRSSLVDGCTRHRLLDKVTLTPRHRSTTSRPQRPEERLDDEPVRRPRRHVPRAGQRRGPALAVAGVRRRARRVDGRPRPRHPPGVPRLRQRALDRHAPPQPGGVDGRRRRTRRRREPGLPSTRVRRRPTTSSTSSASASARRTWRWPSPSRSTPSRPPPALRVGFLERQPRFGWHRGMLLDDATMQVSFLKDLVTLRNPASDFSFLSLPARARPARRLHQPQDACSRCASSSTTTSSGPRPGSTHLVAYGQHGRRRRSRSTDGGAVVAFDVVGRRRRRRASRCAGPATWSWPSAWRRGCRPGVTARPAGVAQPRPAAPGRGRARRRPSPAASSSSAPARARPRPSTTSTAGSRRPRCARCSPGGATRRPTTRPTPTASSTPRPSTLYFGADDDVKRMLFDYHRNTNYSVVDADLINELYRREYQERVHGRPPAADDERLAGGRRRRPGRRASSVDVESPAHRRARAGSTPTPSSTPPATARPTPAALLGEAGGAGPAAADGTADVEPRLPAGARPARAEAAVYVQGGTEHTHGITLDAAVQHRRPHRRDRRVDPRPPGGPPPGAGPPGRGRLPPDEPHPTDHPRATMPPRPPVPAAASSPCSWCWRSPSPPAAVRAATTRRPRPAGGETSDAAGSPAGDGDGFPVEVEHKFGTTTIDAAPEQVVTVGLTDQDAVLALGTVPVGINEWFDTHEHGGGPPGPRSCSTATTARARRRHDAINVEQIAALQPDLILGRLLGPDRAGVRDALADRPHRGPARRVPRLRASPGTSRPASSAGRSGGPTRPTRWSPTWRASCRRRARPTPSSTAPRASVATPYQGTVSVYSPRRTRGGGSSTSLGFGPVEGLEELADDGFVGRRSARSGSTCSTSTPSCGSSTTGEADLAACTPSPCTAGSTSWPRAARSGVSNFEPSWARPRRSRRC